MNEADWSIDKPHLIYKICAVPSGNSNTPTAFAVVKHPYTDTSTCYVKFLRDGMNLYFSLNSNDKQVCRFDWEGDGMFMKIKDGVGNDKEYKIYVGVVNNVPQFVFETNGSQNSGNGVGVPSAGTTIYDSTNVDNGYTAEMVINLTALGFTSLPDSVTLMINIFDPDNYSLGVPPWGNNGNFAKQWWGSEWGGTYRKLNLLDVPVPVELISFTANYDGKVAKLLWSTATETNNRGFEVQSSVNGGEFASVGFVDGKGTTTIMQNYVYYDKDLLPGNSYAYRLKQIDFNGDFAYSKIVELGVISPVNFELMQNYPNPFNPSTKISFSLPQQSDVQLEVFNLLGQKIITLIDKKMNAGKHTIDFNASDLAGGVYLYSLKAVDNNGTVTSLTKKMTLIK
ncbi:T9SS type A sorting domain-containing protein [Ignavibacterium sp.]|uniref:T9SS type A sorting domain-containing protein n=1 Tax=Ignavibacterium sp. TaxID=2651167 RepID=UPI00307F068D